MFIEKCVYIYQVSSSFVVVPIYIPSVEYGLRLFIVVVQELHWLSNCLHVCMISLLSLQQVLLLHSCEIAKYIA